MATAKVSSKYRIVIPRAVRQAIGLKKGQEVTVLAVGGIIRVVPAKDVASFRGAFPESLLDDARDESERDFA